MTIKRNIKQRKNCCVLQKESAVGLATGFKGEMAFRWAREVWEKRLRAAA